MNLSAEQLDSFWQRTREELTREPMAVLLEPVAEPLPYKKYRLTLRSLDGVKVRGWLTLPVQGESPPAPWPVIISTPGYGGTQQGVILSECQRGYAILQLFPRGQGDSTELWTIDGPDKLTWRLEQPEGAYYQGAYADVMRAIDFVVTRPDIDPDRVALVGTSQGGGFSLAVAALDTRVRTVVAHVPFLCDFRVAARTPNSLVKILLDQAGCNDEAALATLDYFDPLQLATHLLVPVLMSAGGRDEICPATTIQSVHDRLPGVKLLKFYPDLAHTSSLNFYQATWPWLDQHLRSVSPTDRVH